MIMKKKVYWYVCIIVCSFVMLFCPGCGNRNTLQNESGNETGKEEETMGNLMILSKEQAQETIELYLQEKYKETYRVSLPFITEDGNYAAEVFIEGNADKTFQVKVDRSSGICRDSRCIKIVESGIREALEKEIDGLWDSCCFEVSCSLSTGVSKQEWDSDASPEDILKQEEVQCQLYLLIQSDQPDKEQEAKLLKKLIDSDCLKNLHLNLDCYYVSDMIFDAACEEIKEGKSIPDTACDSDFINFVNVNWYTRFVIEPEEIIDGFIR